MYMEKDKFAKVIWQLLLGYLKIISRKVKKLPVVRPGTQVRRFTHVYDTVKACIFAWRKNKCKHYSIASKQSFSIIELAKLFKSKIRYLPIRKGERFASALTNMNLNNKIIRLSAKISLKDYVDNFLRIIINFSLQSVF
jgi:UDP-glucose 4-epimerase